ncbi:MAG: family 43 glycosylhydrolase [Arachnia sp.]
MTLNSITPGLPWLDTEGKRIQAHGGSILEVDGTFYWYGENKEFTIPGSDVWHWGVRCYSSTDLYNWTDRGLIIPPEPDDPSSPLHPSAAFMDRPHIVRNPETGQFVCWVKVMSSIGQRSTVLVADDILGPYRMVRRSIKPLGMNAGDFDLVVDPTDGKGYYYFERVHSELICADLTPDYTDVTGYYSTHFPLVKPPHVREAPAYFEREGVHYLITSGTTGYYPNPSMVATAPSYHGPWRALNDPHPDDPTRTSFHSQISSVFRHPTRKDLYIALADRWLPHYLAHSDEAVQAHDARFRPMGGHTNEPFADLTEVNTSLADYVWLPLRFAPDGVFIDWHDEWRVEDFEEETA